jgi:nucleoside-diphosphate-sugar epimerase
MRKKIIFITGAAGEVGHALVKHLAADSDKEIVTMDLRPLPDDIAGMVTQHMTGNLQDQILLARISTQYEIETVYHLAALLSTASEYQPNIAHEVNVAGTLGLLRIASEQSKLRNQSIQFIFPSSIAVYGMPEIAGCKGLYQRVREWEWNQPRTMYGCNKLYCEMLGQYFGKHYRQLAVEQPVTLDFRAVRFPGLISAFTLPTGGTSDYAPEMLHAAAQGKPYACFVGESARLPFMAMPDAVRSLLMLASAPQEKLTRSVYNVRAFSLTAAQIRDRVLKAFPDAEITFQINEKREAIIDSWPGDLDDSPACQDWDWQPEYDADKAFTEYLIPNIQSRYQR